MRETALIAGLIFLFCVFGCQTLKVQEAKSAAGPAGVYLAKTSTPQGVIEFTMIINANGTGRMESVMGNREIPEIIIDDNKFSFNSTVNTQMGKMELAFKGVVEGDKVSGTIGTQIGSLQFSGMRKQEKI